MRRSNIGAENGLDYNLKFFTQFITHPTKTGAILPSGDKLCDMMVEIAGVPEASTIIEFGPGTGVITERVMRQKSEDAVFFAMEINETFVQATKKRCPDATVYRDSALNAGKHLDMHGRPGCDIILSSLPWLTFDAGLQQSLLDTIYEILNPGGRFLTYAYVPGLLFPAAWRLRKKLETTFDNLTKSNIVWSNVPPAFIYIGDKT